MGIGDLLGDNSGTSQSDPFRMTRWEINEAAWKERGWGWGAKIAVIAISVVVFFSLLILTGNLFSEKIGRFYLKSESGIILIISVAVGFSSVYLYKKIR